MLYPRQLAGLGHSTACCLSIQLQTAMAAVQAHSTALCPQQGWSLQRQPLLSGTLPCLWQPMLQRAVELLLHQRQTVLCIRAARMWAAELGSRPASAGQQRSQQAKLGSSSLWRPQPQLQAFPSNTCWQDQKALAQPFKGMSSSSSSFLLRNCVRSSCRDQLSQVWRQPVLGRATLRRGGTLPRGAATQARRQLLPSRATACRSSTLRRVVATQARRLLLGRELEWPGTPSRASGWPTSTLGANRSDRLLLATLWGTLTCPLSQQVDLIFREALHIENLHGCMR